MTCDVCFISLGVSKACVYFFESLHWKKKNLKKPIFSFSFSYCSKENWCHTIWRTGFPTWFPCQDLRLVSARRARTSDVPSLGWHRACPIATLHKHWERATLSLNEWLCKQMLAPDSFQVLNTCLCFNRYSRGSSSAVLEGLSISYQRKILKISCNRNHCFVYSTFKRSEEWAHIFHTPLSCYCDSSVWFFQLYWKLTYNIVLVKGVNVDLIHLHDVKWLPL